MTTKRTRYTRTDTGEYVRRKTHPLDPSRRLRLVGRTSHELEARDAFIESKREEWRLGLITEGQFAGYVRSLERREPARVRPLWDAHVANAAPEHASKLRSVWRHQLAAHFDGVAVVECTAQAMIRWERWMRTEGYKPKTTQDAFYHLVAALRAAMPGSLEALPWELPSGRLWTPRKPTADDVTERPACGTVEQLEALVAAALVIDRSARERGAHADAAQRIAVVALLALRNGEGSGLGWDDLTLEGERPRARIRHQALDQWRKHYGGPRPRKRPKGGRERVVALHPTAIAALNAQRELLELRGWYRADGPVFPSPSGLYAGDWRPNANCIRPETFKRYAALAGLPNAETWVPHSLRHSSATLEDEAGASLKSIQERTGHGSLRVLEQYIHARTGRALVPSAIRPLDVRFDGGDE